MVDFRDAANGGQILGGALQYAFELGLCGVEIVYFDQRAPKCHPCRQIAWMDRQSGPARGDRVFVASGPPVLLSQLGKCNRRRVLLDPASELVNAGIVRHCVYSLITTARSSDPVS